MVNILNLNNNVVEYLPGNSAYGQHGCSGLIGNSGNSIYYASYLCDTSVGENLVKTQIKENRVFSNNESVDEYNSVKYLKNDIIIDLGGTVYKIINTEDIEEEMIEKTGYFFKDQKNTDLPSPDVIITYLNNTDNTQISQPNPYVNTASYCIKEMYIDRTTDKLGCIKISFVFNNIFSTKNYNYAFYVQLPSGELLSTQKNTLNTDDELNIMYANIYIDNRYIFTTLNEQDSNTLKNLKGTSWYGITSGANSENVYIENIYKINSGTATDVDTILNNYCKSLIIYYELIDAQTGEIYKKFINH